MGCKEVFLVVVPEDGLVPVAVVPCGGHSHGVPCMCGSGLGHGLVLVVCIQSHLEEGVA